PLRRSLRDRQSRGDAPALLLSTLHPLPTRRSSPPVAPGRRLERDPLAVRGPDGKLAVVSESQATWGRRSGQLIDPHALLRALDSIQEALSIRRDPWRHVAVDRQIERLDVPVSIDQVKLTLHGRRSRRTWQIDD